MSALVQGIFASFISFTRIPVPWALAEKSFADATWHIPLVAWANVLVLAAMYQCASLPQDLKIFMIMLLPVIISGGMHEDGLADAADGLFGGVDREQRLDIMKDPHIGSFGALGLMLYVLGYYLALKNLPPFAMLSALALALPLSRLAGPLLVVMLPYARKEAESSKARSYLNADRWKIFFSILWTLPVLCFWPLDRSGLAMILAYAITLAGCGWVFKRMIGGITGDCLGAAIKITELAVLWSVVLHFNP